MYTV